MENIYQKYIERGGTPTFHPKELLRYENVLSALTEIYLTRIFKEQYGITINNYIQQQRITLAKQLLRFSDLTIDKIGIECGMNDANYFSRMFKQMEGISPGNYRKTW